MAEPTLKDKKPGDAVKLLGVVSHQNGGGTFVELETAEGTVTWQIVNSAVVHAPTESIPQTAVSRLLSTVVSKVLAAVPKPKEASGG